MVRGRYVWDAEKGEEGLMGDPRYDHKKLEARIHRTTEKYGPFAGKLGSCPHRLFGPVGVGGGYSTRMVVRAESRICTQVVTDVLGSGYAFFQPDSPVPGIEPE